MLYSDECIPTFVMHSDECIPTYRCNLWNLTLSLGKRWGSTLTPQPRLQPETQPQPQRHSQSRRHCHRQARRSACSDMLRNVLSSSGPVHRVMAPPAASRTNNRPSLSSCSMRSTKPLSAGMYGGNRGPDLGIIRLSLLSRRSVRMMIDAVTSHIHHAWSQS